MSPGSSWTLAHRGWFLGLCARSRLSHSSLASSRDLGNTAHWEQALTWREALQSPPFEPKTPSPPPPHALLWPGHRPHPRARGGLQDSGMSLGSRGDRG